MSLGSRVEVLQPRFASMERRVGVLERFRQRDSLELSKLELGWILRDII